MRQRKTAVILLVSSAIVAAVLIACLIGYSKILKLAAFTYYYSGLNIFAQPNYAIPRLPPAENFELVDHLGGSPGAMAVAGNHAFVGYGSEFVVIYIADPSHPRVVGGLTFLSSIKSICVSNTTAYVADGRGGLRIVDISNPEHPEEQSNFGHRSAVQSVAVRGNFAYTAAGIEGVQVLDCSNRKRPRLQWYQDSVPGQYGPDSTTVIAVDDSLCVVDGSSGLRLLDVRDAARPHLLSSVEREGGSECVCAGERNTIIVAGNAGSEGMWIYDLSNTKITLRAAVKVPKYWWASGAVVQGGHAYVATSNGLLIVDLNNPSKPVTVAAWSSAPLSNVAVQNGRAFLTSGAGDFLVVDLADKSKPTLITVLPQTGRAISCCAGDDRVLIGSAGKVQGFRISANGLAKKKPLFSAPVDHGRYIARSRGLTAVLAEISFDPSGCRNWLELWDLDDRAQRRLCRIAVPDSNIRPVFTTNAVTTGGYKGLYIVALPLSKKNPAAKFFPIKQGIGALASKDNTLFVARHNEGGRDALEVYDATNPEQLRVLRSLTLGNSIDGLCCRGNYLYAISGEFLGKNSLIIFDISSPDKITRVSSIELFGGTTVEVDNNIAYVEELTRVSAIDVSDPLRPRVAGKIETIAVPMSVVDLSVHKDLCCLATENEGFYVYKFGAGPAAK